MFSRKLDLYCKFGQGSMDAACHMREVRYTAYYIRKTRLIHIGDYCHMFKFLQGDPVCAVQCTSLHVTWQVCVILLRGLYRSPILKSAECRSYAIWRCSCKILSTYMYIGNVSTGSEVRKHLTDKQAGRQAGM